MRTLCLCGEYFFTENPEQPFVIHESLTPALIALAFPGGTFQRRFLRSDWAGSFVEKAVLLRSSLVSRHTTTKGESWKARASEPKGYVQAWTVEVTAPGVDRAVADKAQTYCPRLEGLGLGF
jgi:hypothetical protein